MRSSIVVVCCWHELAWHDVADNIIDSSNIARTNIDLTMSPNILANRQAILNKIRSKIKHDDMIMRTVIICAIFSDCIILDFIVSEFFLLLPESFHKVLYVFFAQGIDTIEAGRRLVPEVLVDSVCESNEACAS